jgi:predicted DCC family thiol-disulfide oxidoreductase YuxK
MNTETKNLNLILFDGVCNLCEASVQFIIKRDKKRHFYFTSQQSELGQALIKTHQLEEHDSLILISQEKVFLYSDAALYITKELDSKWRYIFIFRFVPKFLRDVVYKIIAKSRYHTFGKKESCMMPSQEIASRFL